ncbi:GDSL-type esterase/lipase family protein, partial [Bacteroidota bacterium]
MKTYQLFIISITFIITGNLYSASNTSEYDTTLIYNTMIKAQNGEDITIGVFGGSITAGSLASSESKRWANLVTDWWINNFTESTVNLINAGIGGTGSDVGVHRINDDLLIYKPDFVIVEFAVNDAGINSTYVQQMLEGVVRQLLDNDIAVMLLLLKMETWGSAQDDHKVVGNYYKIPMVSYADLIDSAVAADGLVLSDVFGDSPGVHPNDAGMQYIADFIIEELDIIHNSIPTGASIIEITDTLPAPIISNNYDKTFKYTNKILAPESNKGWSIKGDGWFAEEINSEISFKVDGNAVSILYSKHNDDFRGRAEVWIDNGTPITLDAYWEETWGPATKFQLVKDGMESGEHTLHVKIIEESSNEGERHYFEIQNVLKAGNIVNIAPIADPGDKKKILTGTEVTLDGSASFDPDSTNDITYSWSLISSPENSNLTIDNS